jgi:hypothetical protein
MDVVAVLTRVLQEQQRALQADEATIAEVAVWRQAGRRRGPARRRP